MKVTPAVPQLRLARAADIERLMAIRAAVRENRLSDPASIGTADYLEYIRRGHCWACELDGRIAGFAALDVEAASVWALFVAPGAEGRGVGRSLLERLTGESRRAGLSHLHLETSAGTRAERLYRRAGWEMLGCEPDGVLRMRLELARPR
jgi:GNAT superfamily N-acetyltransferase